MPASVPSLARARRAIALLCSCCVLLGAAVLVLCLRAPTARGGPAAPDDLSRQQLVEQLVANGGGLYDSHPDADVGHVLLPKLVDRQDAGTKLSSNSHGIREREWAVSKPPGTLRVVLLGDSFVHGLGVEAEQRCGVQLERELAARAGVSAPIEVLHIGITSWDIAAEAAFLRRQLSSLAPDLVLHHIVPNDLDDTAGVRGFGAPGRLAPRHPERGDTLVSLAWGRWTFHPKARGLLPWGQDGESRVRLAEAAGDIERLARVVEASGCRYELLINWQAYQVVAGQHFARRLPADHVNWLSWEFYRDPAYRISAVDEHWNPAGHERVARYLYGLIRAKGLLPLLQLGAWPEAEAVYAGIDGTGRQEAGRVAGLPAQLARQSVGPAVDLAAMTRDTAGQIYGGIDREGLVGPWAALVLARAGGSELVIEGAHLDRQELDGASIAIEVDEVRVATLWARAGQQVALRVALPAAVAGRDWLAIRFVADDFVYTGRGSRRLACFRLERAAIE